MFKRDLVTSLGGFLQKMLHLLWQATQIRSEIPAVLWHLGFVSLFAQQNFDCGLRPSLRVTGGNAHLRLLGTSKAPSPTKIGVQN